jgi:lactococcin 972 family bacteriocin
MVRGKRGKRRLLAAVIAGAAATVAVAGPALATTEYVGGGTWKYGVYSLNWSDYHHPSKRHRSSVSSQMYGLVRSACENPGIWSHAVEPAAATGNKAYWSNSC